jgi:5-methylcytosine-specific restriction endonuclease McrA
MYEIYKIVKTKEEYFGTWDKKNVEMLTPELKENIYSRYVVKAFVFQRDEFKCKNEGCKHHSSELTMHHIKFQKNNGKDSVKNCITLCRVCHNGFHRAKNELTFNGATYKVNKAISINWKEQRKENRKLRKELRAELITNPIHISAALFEQLMRFLMINIDEVEDTEEDD